MTELGLPDLDAASSIDAVKDSVASSLASADAGVRIQRTEYFNHTYAPDLVLEWPNDKTSRRVYLRTTSNLEYLQEDIALIDEKSSIIVPLGQPSAAELETDAGLNQSSHTEHVLVARSSSFTLLGERREATPVVALASRAVLQGGSGTLGLDKASTFTSSFVAGFEGAQVGDVESTAVAIETAEDVLDHKRTIQVGDFLHAVWVGSGVDTLTYPGEFRLDASLTAAGLELLLDTADIEDAAFWSRIGNSLTMEKIEQLEFDVSHENFQRLVTAAAKNLKVRSCRVTSLAEPSIASPAWYANRSELGLRVAGIDILLASKNLSEVSRDGVAQSIPVTTVSERASEASIELSEITIDTNNRRLDYATADGTSVTEDEKLKGLHASMGTTSSVSRVVVQSTNPHLIVDFTTSTAHGRSSSVFTLPTIVMNSVPLLAPLTEVEQESLALAVGIAPRDESSETSAEDEER